MSLTDVGPTRSDSTPPWLSEVLGSRATRVAPVSHTRGEALGLTLLLASTAVLYLWHLNISGMANQYYSAAALSGSQSWKALFFGSLDAGGSITVDKPPLALWPMALMVKAFGLSSWSVLVPQALEGVATVALLYGSVRRSTASAGAALLSGAIFAFTPIVVLMFRYNNPDAMLTLLMVAAAYTTIRALDSRYAARWLALTGALVGTAFMCKLLQAFMILPSLVLVYAVFSAVPVRRRLVHLLAASGTTIVAAGWWMLTVELWPASSRPWVGGSTGNSVLELALGYNGVGRLTGNESAASTSAGWHGTNFSRMFGVPVGTGVMWLMPAALIMAAGALRASRGARQGDRATNGALCLWLSWLLVSMLVFCLMAGIFHSYYTIVLAPAIAALVGVSGHIMWRSRHQKPVGSVLAVASATTTIVAAVLQNSHPGELTALTPWMWILGVASMSAPLIDVVPKLAGQVIVGVAVAAAVVSPMVYGLATAAVPHAGSGPQAGPGPGQVNNQVSPAMIRALRSGPGRYDWVAAVPGARASSAYQLASRRPVIGIGGYKESDPSPTLDTFRSWVRDGRVHYYIDAVPGGVPTQTIRSWVQANFAPERLGGQIVYDLSGGR